MLPTQRYTNPTEVNGASDSQSKPTTFNDHSLSNNSSFANSEDNYYRFEAQKSSFEEEGCNAARESVKNNRVSSPIASSSCPKIKECNNEEEKFLKCIDNRNMSKTLTRLLLFTAFMKQMGAKITNEIDSMGIFSNQINHVKDRVLHGKVGMESMKNVEDIFSFNLSHCNSTNPHSTKNLIASILSKAYKDPGCNFAKIFSNLGIEIDIDKVNELVLPPNNLPQVFSEMHHDGLHRKDFFDLRNLLAFAVILDAEHPCIIRSKQGQTEANRVETLAPLMASSSTQNKVESIVEIIPLEVFEKEEFLKYMIDDNISKQFLHVFDAKFMKELEANISTKNNDVSMCILLKHLNCVRNRVQKDEEVNTMEEISFTENTVEDIPFIGNSVEDIFFIGTPKWSTEQFLASTLYHALIHPECCFVEKFSSLGIEIDINKLIDISDNPPLTDAENIIREKMFGDYGEYRNEVFDFETLLLFAIILDFEVSIIRSKQKQTESKLSPPLNASSSTQNKVDPTVEATRNDHNFFL